MAAFDAAATDIECHYCRRARHNAHISGSRPVANVRRMRHSTLMRTIYIDCEGAESADEVWQRYVDAVNPENAAVFGRNLDAFWDAVEHGGPGWPGPVKLVFLHSQRLAALRTRNGLSLFAGLRQIADEATQTSIELA